MEHLLKSSAVIIIFYACYTLFLQRETFFEQNRCFLIIGLFTSFILPFLVIPVYVETTPLDLSNITFETAVTTQTIEKQFNILDYFPLIYSLGVAFFTIRFLVQFSSLGLVIFRNKGEKVDGFIFVKTNKNISPFSFFNWIVFNPNQFSETELNQILTHEKIHASQKHSFDILLTHISCILLWFNPFIWLYTSHLKQNLEFIADKETANKTQCKKSYQYTLLKTSMPSHQMALSNPFYNSLIKKRIVMLHKSKSKKINQLKYALVIPVLALFLMSFNTEEVYVSKNQKKNIYSNVGNKLERQKANNPDTLKVIFNKDLSDKDLEKIESTLKKINIIFIYSELKRNEKGEIINIDTKFESEGGHCTYTTDEVPIEPFYYFRLGTTSGVGTLKKKIIFNDSKVITDNDENHSVKEKIIIKNGDTLHVLKNADGKTVTVAIDDDGAKIKKTIRLRTNENGNEKSSTSDDDKIIVVGSKTISDESPLYILDGKEITKDIMSSINPNSIQSIDVIKGDNATRQFGEKGKDGVVLITSKNENNKNINGTKTVSEIKIVGYGTKKTPLYIVNGKEISKEAFEKINPEDIASIDVFKDDIATKKYGDKGKNGVVEITTKKKK